jgi:hypothetical protein
VKRLVAISLAGAMFATAGLAQSSNPWLEQWFKTKTGHYSPMEEARQRSGQRRTERANAAFRERTTLEAVPPNGSAVRTNPWLEQWFKTKFGHYSPMEEARLRAEQANRSKQERADSGKLLGSL